jgi:hypothetical protein
MTPGSAGFAGAAGAGRNGFRRGRLLRRRRRLRRGRGGGRAIGVFVGGAEFRQQRQAHFARQGLDRAGAVGDADRQHAGCAQRRDQFDYGSCVRTFTQTAKVEDHRRVLEQLGRAAHATAHFLGEPGRVERADAQVGDADLADLQFAGLLVIGSDRHAQVPVASCGLRPGSVRATSQGWSGSLPAYESRTYG